MKENPRRLAFDILFKIEKDNAYSNLILDALLPSSGLEARDKAFVSALIYGVTERRLTIDYQLALYLDKPLKKLKPQVLIILRLGMYQLLFMDKIPDSACVNESVKLTKSCGCAYASSLVNAVLRKCAKNGLVLPKEDSPDYISVRYSCPLWLCEKWINEYGLDDTKALLDASNGCVDTVIRVNTVKTDTDTLKAMLGKEGVSVFDGYVPDSLILKDFGALETLKSFRDGFFHVQDTASQLCVKALNPLPGQTVFDVCSAPGGKAFTAAQLMKNCGKVLAFDIYEHRAKLIEKGAKRLGLGMISADVGDAAVFNPELPQADRVLCDVPCSGLGIIRRKPEIRYKGQESLKGLPDIQLQILKTASGYLKIGGRLVYSTCTLNRDENEAVVHRFLSENSSFVLADGNDSMLTLMPHKNNSDGFFIAVLERIR
ncbi:MAG: 16S rRNA (cytosine(967)-C(5))-methyltransferase RsmB [Oscillospiraceae bacterium]|nr:16S rRNA (cytosine(967)-C(5))-methyltransferase RsmB [Oscillospiraceae bacterium]